MPYPYSGTNETLRAWSGPEIGRIFKLAFVAARPTFLEKGTVPNRTTQLYWSFTLRAFPFHSVGQARSEAYLFFRKL